MRDILDLQFRIGLKTKYLCKVLSERLLLEYPLFHTYSEYF